MFSEIVKKYAPWSFSMVSELQNCPLQFKLKRIDKEKAEEASDGSAVRVGSALHKALELVLKDSSIKTRDAIDSAILSCQVTEKEAPKVWSNCANIDLFISKLKRLDESFGFLEVHTEKRYAFDKDFNPCEFWDNKNGFFRGVVDLLIVTKHNVMVFDHKSGRPFGGIEPYVPQLDVYNLFAFIHYADTHPIWDEAGVKTAIDFDTYSYQSGINFISTDEIIYSEPKTRGWMRDASKEHFAKWLNENTKKAGSSETIKSKRCDWCGYKSKCPEFNK